jgi:D-beta-D-heptose 7-phosphate kinase/D-beta-D-heptose 1-phosphate adenosyltransferase
MRVGFVNGCFDILHVGHIRLFEYAKSMCDYLVVAIDSDERVRANKGVKRPFNCLEDRKLMLSSLRCIDEVKSFSTDDELASLVMNIVPDVMVVGDDYMDKRVIGSEYAKELKFYRKVDGYSTTKILESAVSW